MSSPLLEGQIATDLRGRQGHALSSFEHALPAPDSELVRDAIAVLTELSAALTSR